VVVDPNDTVWAAKQVILDKLNQVCSWPLFQLVNISSVTIHLSLGAAGSAKKSPKLQSLPAHWYQWDGEAGEVPGRWPDAH